MEGYFLALSMLTCLILRIGLGKVAFLNDNDKWQRYQNDFNVSLIFDKDY